jgi:hypothetical protein
MPETINWLVTVEAMLGPRLSAKGSHVVDAYDKFSVQLEAGAVDVDVDVQPSGDAGVVEVFMLRANSYDSAVTFSADAGATTSVLNGPLVLIGSGCVALLADPPQTLRFANPSANPVDTDILVGRQA